MKWRDLCSSTCPDARAAATSPPPSHQHCITTTTIHLHSYAPPQGTDTLTETAVQKDAHPSWWPHSAEHIGSYLIGKELAKAQCSHTSTEILHCGTQDLHSALREGSWRYLAGHEITHAM